MPRRARLDAPGTLHHVIIRGIEKRLIVNDNQDRKMFVERLSDLSQHIDTQIYAWALMPNHAHFLMRSGQQGLAAFMRKFLTGYAVSYNRRHKRHGHLFQNRYKSIVVEEDAYFKELVRYIHLNPLRAGLIRSFSALDRYPWCGHSVLMGYRKNNWQDSNFVLRCFGTKSAQARRAYRQFVEQGIAQGRQPHLVGGGLVRSAGGWSEVKTLRRLGREELGDERILGSGAFVASILSDVDLANKYRLACLDRHKMATDLVDNCCRDSGISVAALHGGGRRRNISKVRRLLACKLTEELGLSFAETARLLGVSTSAIAKILSSGKK